MRHRSGLKKLNITDGAHRRAMMRHLANALIRHERINTTLARAKVLRRVVEPLITRGKTPTVANRRLVFARLGDRSSVIKIFDELGDRYRERPGGYLRILKHGYRKGDNAPMALVELLDRPTPDLPPESEPESENDTTPAAESESSESESPSKPESPSDQK